MTLKNLLILPLLFLMACGSTSTDSSSQAHSGTPIASCPEKLRFAVTDIAGEAQLKEQFGTFQATLEEVLGLAIELYPVSDRVTAVPALLFQQIDVALAGPSEYVLMQANAQAVPLVGITRPGYYTVVLARADGKIDNLEALNGKTLGIREEGSTASHLGALKLLTDIGLEAREDFAVEIIGSDRGLVALKDGQLDAWSDGNPHYQRALEKYNLDESEFTIIAKGKLLPNDLFVANPSLEAQCLEAMRSRIIENESQLIEAIVASPANKKYAESQIVPANDEDYDLIRAGYKAIGKDDLL